MTKEEILAAIEKDSHPPGDDGITVEDYAAQYKCSRATAERIIWATVKRGALLRGKRQRRSSRGTGRWVWEYVYRLPEKKRK